jgi:hypothetical protein
MSGARRPTTFHDGLKLTLHVARSEYAADAAPHAFKEPQAV